MPIIHHVVAGKGRPAVVFVHGFGCAHSGWDAQVAHLSQRHLTVAVDLSGHGASPGIAADGSIERYGADVAEVMQALFLPPAVLVGHSVGCRVVVEAALQAPAHAAGIVLLDGSEFAPAMETVLKQTFTTPNGFEALIRRWFEEMFTAKSDAALVGSVVERAERLPRSIGEKLLTDILRYDVGRLTTSLADLRVPVVAVQATYGNEKRERRPMSKGQTTPYLDMLRARVPSARIEIIEDTGHFPQIDEAAQTNALLDSFLATIPARWGILTPGRPITALRFGCPASKGRWVSLNACSVALEGMDTMKFGLCYIPDYHEELSGSWYDWYEGMIAEVKLAELLGFHGAWFAEHRVSVTLDHG